MTKARPAQTAGSRCWAASLMITSRRERPCRCAAECSQQFPPSDGDCHTPLPCEVREGNDTTPRACSLHVQGGQDAGCIQFCRRLRVKKLVRFWPIYDGTAGTAACSFPRALSLGGYAGVERVRFEIRASSHLIPRFPDF